MKTILKIALVFLLLVLLALGILWLTIARQWPWWAGAGIFLGVIGLVVLAVALVHHARRRRERRFVQRVVSEDTAAIGNAPIQERQALQDLQSRWTEAIDQLRHSFLRKRGNPLYVLPWFLVIGESGAGKTSAIARSGLNSILGERRRAGPIASTRNCDWWFFEQAIVLDTAGRYTIPIDEGPDKEEWKRFLTLLAKYRRREPINGVVVVVPADQILARDARKLRDDALDIRRRLDHVMRTLGTKAPVYVMVTKMDHVLGMTAFAQALGERAGQAMGYTNEAKDPGWEAVLDATMATIGRRLAELRFDLVREAPPAGPGLLLFPSEFAKLQPGLALFLGTLFQETAYLETPLLRGLFFSSAAPGGSQPDAGFLRAFGLRDPAGAGLQDGVFLKAFFEAILPRDRHLHRPIQEFLEWSRVRRNLAFLAWSFLWLGALGLMGAAFTQNLRAINAFSLHWHNLPQISGDVAKDLLAVDQVRMEVTSMKRINRNWWIPRFGLKQSLQAERVAQDAWLKVFRQGLLEPMDAAAWHLAEPGKRGKETYGGRYAGYLVTRMALLRSALDNRAMAVDQPPPILASFTKASADLLLNLHPDLSPDIAELYGQNYLADILWNDDVAARTRKLGELRTDLVRIVSREDNDLRWMTDSWIPDTADVPLEEFWGEPEQPFEDKPAVPGAYTREGRQRIKAFTELLDSTLYESKVLPPKLAKFWDAYDHQFNAAWLAFARRFREGAQGAVSPLGRQRMATLMTTRENPYFRLLTRMAAEVGSQGPPPAPWALLLAQLNRARELADQQLAEKANASTLDKLNLERKKQVQTWEGKLDASKAKEFEVCMAASKSWLEYLAALQEITPNLLSRANARRQMLQCFGGGEDKGDEGAAGGSPFLKAQGSILAAEVLLGNDSTSKAVWDLVRGPLDHTMAYCLDETAAVLQELWEQNVLSSTREKDPGQLHRLLFNANEGKVWAFIKGPAKPFVVKTDTGYATRRAFSQHTLPFAPAFFAFLKASEDGNLSYQQSFSITLETLPLEVNPGAQVTPIGSKLCLQTPEKGRDCLENYNFSQKAAFKWEPETSGEASLQILLPSLTLTRNWPGPSGFAHFLEELETGSRAYAPKDFPEVEDKLKALGITWIRVAYKFQGNDQALRHFRRAPTAVPRTIVATEAAD